MKKFLILSIAILWSTIGFAQLNPNATIPQDPALRIGKLPNGMTYYIRHNEEPKQRADFYIIQNVGAVLENDNQDGLAHFLEHMAFNGSKNFPKSGTLISTLERHGIAFGRNINAGTSQGETVYYLNDIPVSNDKLLDTCLLVLHDWSHYISLDSAEIDNERGVIGEEWRTRRNADTRLSEQMLPVIFAGSMYGTRDVIGDPEIIKNFKYETLRSFYHDWYRTDLQAIAVVGDIDVDQMEAKIKARFSTIPAVKNPKPRLFTVIPERTDIGYVCATDPEVTNSSVSIYMIQADPTKTNVKGMKEDVIQSLYNDMIGKRLQEEFMEGNPNLLSEGAVQVGEIARNYKTFYLLANAAPNCEGEALKSVYTQAEKAKRFGFTTGELERSKARKMANLELYYKQRDKIANEDYVHEIIDLFLKGAPTPSVDYYYDIQKQLIPNITLEEVAEFAQTAPHRKNMVIIVSGPNQGVKHLTKDECVALLDQIEKTPLEPYTEEISTTSLVPNELKGSKIVSTRTIPVLNAAEWTLANGAKVVFKQSDFSKNSISLQGYSEGGSSLYNTDLLPSATLASQLPGMFGVGDFNMVALNKMLSGKKVGLQTSINNLSEGIQGEAAVNDVETLFQLLYLRFEKPRFDEQVFNTAMERQRTLVAARKNSTDEMLGDSLRMITTDYNPRTLLLNEAFFDQVTLEKIEKIYRDRIQDASNFTFFLVGDMTPEAIKPLVEKYIGSISSTNRKESWVDNKVRAPKGKVVRQIELPFPTPKSTVVTVFNKEIPYTAQNIRYMKMLQEVLDLRYTTNIREKEGGTYGVSVRGQLSKSPFENGVISVSFDCNPEKGDHLKSLVYKDIEDLIKDGVTPEELDKVIKNMRKNREQLLNQNAYVMSALISYYTRGINETDPANFELILDQVKPVDIQNFAAKFFDKADVIDLIFTSKK